MFQKLETGHPVTIKRNRERVVANLSGDSIGLVIKNPDRFSFALLAIVHLPNKSFSVCDHARLVVMRFLFINDAYSYRPIFCL